MVWRFCPYNLAMPAITTRSCPADARALLEQAGLAPAWAKLYAARGITHPEQIAHRLPQLLPPAGLLHIEHAAALLADAVDTKKRLLIIPCVRACARGLGAGLRGAEVSAPSHPRPLQTRPRWLSGASPGSHSLLRPARPRRCRSSAPAASQPPRPRGL